MPSVAGGDSASPLAPDQPIHPRIEELTAHLARTRAHLGRTIDAVPLDDREVAPPDGGWTVAQVVEHLARIEQMITGLFAGMVAAGRAKGLAEETDESPLLEGFKGHRIHNRTIKVVAPERAVPPPTVLLEDAWVALTSARHALLREVAAADGLALGELKYTHANLGEMSMYQWIAFVGFHEMRHAAQIEEIAAALASRRTAPA